MLDQIRPPLDHRRSTGIAIAVVSGRSATKGASEVNVPTLTIVLSWNRGRRRRRKGPSERRSMQRRSSRLRGQKTVPSARGDFFSAPHPSGQDKRNVPSDDKAIRCVVRLNFIFASVPWIEEGRRPVQWPYSAGRRRLLRAMIIYQQRDRAVKKAEGAAWGSERAVSREGRSGNDPLPAK